MRSASRARLRSDQQHSCTVDLYLGARAVRDDGAIDVADVVPGDPVTELEHDAVVPVVSRRSHTGEERHRRARALDDHRIGGRPVEGRRAGRLGRRFGCRCNLVVLAVAAGEEQCCDDHEESTRHHLQRTLARRETRPIPAPYGDDHGAIGAIASCRGATELQHDVVDPEQNARTRKRSIALRLDGRAWLRVEPEVLPELAIADGDEVDDNRKAAIEAALARARARLFVVRSLAVRMQSRVEIERKLAARDVPTEIAHEAIERAAGYGYIDDEALAGQLARGMRARGYGRRRAEQKLRSRGLSGALTERALADTYDGTEDEEVIARTALRRSARRHRR